jgi:hypothetical protein
MSRREKELLSSSFASAAALFFGSAFVGVDGTGLRWRTSAMVTDPMGMDNRMNNWGGESWETRTGGRINWPRSMKWPEARR